MRETVGKYLASHPRRRGEQKRLAEQLGVSARTLRNWRVAAVRHGPPRPPGRPARDAACVRVARWQAARIWRRLPRGHDGWRSVKTELERRGVEITIALVQELVKALKARHAQRARKRLERERAHVDVKLRDAMWSVDETALGRDAHGAVHGVVVRETFVPKILSVVVGAPLTGAQLVRILESAARMRGSWPLVASLDNGGANRSGLVRECLESHGVVVLFNLPHTPQHNAFVECGIAAVKRACWLDAGTVLPVDELPRSRADLEARLQCASRALEQAPRWSLGGKTPAEIDAQAPRAQDRVCRACFYAEVHAALERIAEQPLNARARRRAEREAILCALERHGLVVRTSGGGQTSRHSKRKEFP